MGRSSLWQILWLIRLVRDQYQASTNLVAMGHWRALSEVLVHDGHVRGHDGGGHDYGRECAQLR